jgi:hypothetical protein
MSCLYAMSVTVEGEGVIDVELSGYFPSTLIEHNSVTLLFLTLIILSLSRLFQFHILT